MIYWFIQVEKIYQNHQENVRKYDKVKPLSILITKDISKAKEFIYEEFRQVSIEFYED